MGGSSPNLLSLRNDTLLQDIHFLFDNGEQIGAHKCVLALRSPVFRSMLDPSHKWLPGGEVGKISLPGKLPSEFNLLLEYFYSHDAALVDEQSAAILLTLADEYQVWPLKDICEEWLVNHVDASTCVDCLLLASTYRCNTLEAASKEMLVRQFEDVVSSEGFARLPADQLDEALQRDSLCVSSEESVFQACVRWHELQEATPPSEVWERLLRSVRFHTMDLAYLRAHVVGHPSLKASVPIAEGIRQLASPTRRAKRKADATSQDLPGASPSTPTPDGTGTPPRKRVALLRNSNGLIFRYGSSTQGDVEVPERGLFHWIGTDGGQRAWSNPSARGEVRLTRLENIFGSWIDLEAQAAGESVPLLDEQFRVQSWKLGPLRPPGTLRRFYHQLVIDLGPTRSLLLTHYVAMIEPRNRRGETEVCRWGLAGSNDGEEWVDLHRGSWCLQQDLLFASPVSGVCAAHRYFRFLSPSGGKGGGFEWWERLLFTRLELYGTLFTEQPFKRSLRRRIHN